MLLQSIPWVVGAIVYPLAYMISPNPGVAAGATLAVLAVAIIFVNL